MRVPNAHEQKSRSLLTIAALVITVLIGTAVLGFGKSNSINITINNQSQRSILHLYLAAGDPNNWGPDQLNGSTIPPGGSHALNNVTCNGSSVRVIAEDQNGCFVYYNASCDSNQTWNISDSTTPDCGNQGVR